MITRKIKDIISGLDAVLPEGAGEMECTSIAYDSRRVTPDGLFVAVRGFTVDGHKYLQKAFDNGAAAAIVEEADLNIDRVQCIISDTRAALPVLAYNFYSKEIAGMRLIGVTGTNGKTTTAYLVKSLLDQAGYHAGMIGTIAHVVGQKSVVANNTTPESVDICAMLAEMHMAGQEDCVMEVSSHALALHRVDGLKYKVAVFSNLTRDHLDFHADMEEYFQVKKKLFHLLDDDGTAVVNLDDPYGARLYEELDANKIGFSVNQSADVAMIHGESTLEGVRFTAATPAGEIEINSSLLGDFSFANILSVIAVGIALKMDPGKIKAGIEAMHAVPGRLEKVRLDGGRLAVVDYSHTPDALEKALKTLRPLTPGKLKVVFGCGGNRDKVKRPQMGEIAARLADEVFVTSDNPRFEEPAAIIEDILAGIPQRETIRVEENRRTAIGLAIKNSSDGDVILVAGKGHEDYQEIKGVKYPFSDRLVIEESA
jgi:UDP-N-acetylmuramoyl-L-alanyl-D-glutamate--2,6-diaminopimelate ligase